MSELEQTLTCYFHPKVETQLRCNRCDKPICIKCATHTPTGYRCPECIRSQQKTFVTTKWFDQVIAAGISGAIAALGSLFTFLGFYSLFVAFAVGSAAVWLVKKAISNRRSPTLKYVMSGAALIGGLVPPVITVIREISFYGGFYSIYSILWDLVYAVILAGVVYYQLRN